MILKTLRKITTKTLRTMVKRTTIIISGKRDVALLMEI